MGKLTALAARALSKPGRRGDGDGLYLNVAPSGSKSWVQRIVIDGRRRDMGLGPYPSSTATGAAITQPLKASSSSEDGGRCPVDTSLAARSPMASARHASCSGVSLLLSLTTTATGAGVTVGERVGLDADVAVGEGVGLGTNVAVGEGVGFDSPPHATETTSNRAAIATINGDHRMTKPGTSLSICVSVAGAGRRSMQSH